MRAPTLLSLVLAMPAHADDAHRPQPSAAVAVPWITGAQLIHKLDNPNEAAEAVAYLKGVIDATADKDWCRSLSKPSTAALQSTLVDGLRALPLQEANRSAGALAVRIWQEKWPRSRYGCCHG